MSAGAHETAAGVIAEPQVAPKGLPELSLTDYSGSEGDAESVVSTETISGASANDDNDSDNSSTTTATNAIDWEALLAVECRMADEEPEYLNARLDAIHARAHEEETTPQPLLTLDEMRAVIARADAEAPYNDIPNLHKRAYDDTELTVWSALLADYATVATKIPKYVNITVWAGVPPALRGRAWRAMAQADSPTLQSLYDALAAEWTPFVKIIGRDLHRTFPEIRMFEARDGDGQVKLGRVLRAFAAYDMQVGYCQGLTFLAGPLLLHMDEREAFCVLVKLMEDYDVRSMFTADMAGLQLRMFQFDKLFAKFAPDLHTHFQELEVNNIYVSQWFLSFFAVTCPLSMLVRIYDLMFAEGAVPTFMRVALAVLQRNKTALMAYQDEEQVMELLLGRGLWTAYSADADLLVSDIKSVSPELLADLRSSEAAYSSAGKLERARSRRKVKGSAAGRLKALGARLPSMSWANYSHGSSVASLSNASAVSSSNLSVTSNASRPSSIMSFQSASTVSASDGNSSHRASTTSVSSVESSSDASSVESKEVARLKLALQVERREREADRDLISQLLAKVPALTENNGDDQLASVVRDLKTRLRLDDGTTPPAAGASQCTQCDRLFMDLAEARSREALLKQEVDDLRDELHQFHDDKPATPAATPAKTLNPKPSKWNLW